MKNIAGYWTGSFQGTNIGGVSFGIDQQGAVLGGVATMHEPSLGTYQYVISGQMGSPIKLQLNPAAAHSPNLVLGVIDANCQLQPDGSLLGNWQSSVGTNGLFSAQRYQPTSAAAGKPKRTHVFVSYCHVDAEYLNGLSVHLRPLEKAGLIDAWSDQRIKAGSLWKVDIEAALARANVAILLISASFLASEFIVNNELPPLLSRAQSDGLRILPVIVRPCRFTRDVSLSCFQAINDPKAPLASLEDWQKDAVYDRIAHEIENLSSLK